MTLLHLAGGLIYLLMGGDLLVRGAVALARRAHIPPGIVALTIVAFGTSLPELVVTVQAALGGYPGMAIGNVVGSNIANVLLVCGVPAIVYPLATDQRNMRRDATAMLVVSIAFVLVAIFGELHRWAGAALLAGLLAMAAFSLNEALEARQNADRGTPLEWVLGLPARTWMIVVFIVAGAIGLPIGANLVVDAGGEIAGQLGVPDSVVGLSMVAVGTSLPELATTVIAAVKRETDVLVGTAIGSNLLNILAIMGVTAMVSPTAIPVPSPFAYLDLPVMLAAAAVLTAFAWRGRPIRRAGGIALVLAYVGYIAVIYGAA